MANELTIINPITIGKELQKYKVQMEAALPRHITADRMARIALTSLRVNPKLYNCTRESFFGSLMASAQLGLEPGINGQCYLIPYGTTCTLVPGWKGFMELLSRTGRASAWTNAVYDGDEFDYEYGDKPFVHHKPGKWTGKEAALMFTYAVGRQKEAEWPVIEVWDIDKVWAHRNKQNKVGDRHYSYAHPEMYARKIPLLQVLKYLPSSIELANASALDVTASEGRQALTIDMALKGDLESGADSGTATIDPEDPQEQELESLFEKLQKNPTERKMLRDSYQGRKDELIKYLNGRLAPTIQVSTQQEQKQEVSMAQEKEQPEQTQSAGEQPKRGRGRPRKAETQQVTAQETTKQDDSEIAGDDQEDAVQRESGLVEESEQQSTGTPVEGKFVF